MRECLTLADLGIELGGVLKSMNLWIRIYRPNNGYCKIGAFDGSTIRQPYCGAPCDWITAISLPTIGHDDKEISIAVNFGSPFKPNPQFIYECIREVMAHEIAESFKVDGQFFREPHEPARYLSPDALTVDIFQGKP